MDGNQVHQLQAAFEVAMSTGMSYVFGLDYASRTLISRQYPHLSAPENALIHEFKWALGTKKITHTTLQSLRIQGYLTIVRIVLPYEPTVLPIIFNSKFTQAFDGSAACLKNVLTVRHESTSKLDPSTPPEAISDAWRAAMMSLGYLK